jgi:hypothetical protein
MQVRGESKREFLRFDGKHWQRCLNLPQSDAVDQMKGINECGTSGWQKPFEWLQAPRFCAEAQSSTDVMDDGDDFFVGALFPRRLFRSRKFPPAGRQTCADAVRRGTPLGVMCQTLKKIARPVLQVQVQVQVHCAVHSFAVILITGTP